MLCMLHVLAVRHNCRLVNHLDRTYQLALAAVKAVTGSDRGRARAVRRDACVGSVHEHDAGIYMTPPHGRSDAHADPGVGFISSPLQAVTNFTRQAGRQAHSALRTGICTTLQLYTHYSRRQSDRSADVTCMYNYKQQALHTAGVQVLYDNKRHATGNKPLAGTGSLCVCLPCRHSRTTKQNRERVCMTRQQTDEPMPVRRILVPVLRTRSPAVYTPKLYMGWGDLAADSLSYSQDLS